MARNRAAWRSVLVVAALGLTAFSDLSYVVAKGDTLAKIARRHGTDERTLARLNHLPNPNLLRIGQQLRIPSAAPAPVPPPEVPTTVRHTVVAGEHLTAIARRYGTTVPALAQLNQLPDANRLRAGQVLTVPVQVEPAAVAEPSVEELLVRYSRRYGVDPNLVKAIAWQESGWKQGVVSHTGAVGVMQVQPDTGDFAAQVLLAHPVNLAETEHNVKAGVRFLAYLMRETKGNETYAIGAYYQGLRSVRVRGLLPETKHYIANVKALRKRFAAGA